MTKKIFAVLVNLKARQKKLQIGVLTVKSLYVLFQGPSCYTIRRDPTARINIYILMKIVKIIIQKRTYIVPHKARGYVLTLLFAM